MNETPEASSAQIATAGGDSAIAPRTDVELSNERWQQLDQRAYACIDLWVKQWWEPQHNILLDAIGEVFGEHRASVRETITNLIERVIRLETTSTFEERFTKLAHEAKSKSEIPQDELLAKIEGLQRQVDELKKVAARPGPQGPPGRLPLVKEYVADRVHYEADVIAHAGALWQARGDTVHPPPHADWICLAWAGRDAQTPTIRGTYDDCEKYKKLDIVACNGASFIAKHDNPSICPGNGWQLMSGQGKQGRRGHDGERGERGEPGADRPLTWSNFGQSSTSRAAVVVASSNVGSLRRVPLRSERSETTRSGRCDIVSGSWNGECRGQDNDSINAFASFRS